MIRKVIKTMWDIIEPKLNKKIIHGCQQNPIPLLTRYKLFQSKIADLNIHILHRSDEDRELHSHPWNFVTLVLWNGYIEHLPENKSRRIKPFRILYRPASWVHRVEIIENKPAVTLSLMSRKTTDWGFFTSSGFVHWKDFLFSKGCVED
jgi:hypothetical protein